MHSIFISLAHIYTNTRVLCFFKPIHHHLIFQLNTIQSHFLPYPALPLPPPPAPSPVLVQSKPLQNLSKEKPPSSAFCRSATVSVAGQFIAHLTCLVATLALCESHMIDDEHSMSADGKFQPNVVNSAVFLLSAVIQVRLPFFVRFPLISSLLLLFIFICFVHLLYICAMRFCTSIMTLLFCSTIMIYHFMHLKVNNFVVNYRGHPFTQSIQENVALWRSVQFIYAALLIIAGGQLEPLNDLLQMAPFPSPTFQAYLIGILLCNFGFCFSVEKLCQKFLE